MAETPRSGAIYDLGYRPYEGPRTSQGAMAWALFVAGFLAGALEINVNIEADKLEAQMGRRIMNRVHGMWSLGFFITALIGAAMGIPLGLFLAALITQALSKYGVGFSLPIVELVAFTAVAIVAGVLAAIIPARRASRINVLSALQYE